MTAVAVQLCIFSLGWLSLHALRAYAHYITPVLACAAVALVLTILAVLSARYGVPADPGTIIGQWTAE